MFTRRLFIGSTIASALAAPAILRADGIGWRSFPFSLGIASGEPTSDGVVLWTRIAPDPMEPHGGMAMGGVPVQWEVASDDRFATIVARGEEMARPELAHSVHVEVGGLLPDRPYWYRFTAGGERSFTGRTRTLPLATSTPDRLRFGVVGCQNYEDGYFTAYGHLAREDDLAFVYHYGDYIYEYRGSPTGASYFTGGLRVPVREYAGQTCYDLTDYRQRYAQTKMDVDLQRTHAVHPFFMSYDDHEVANNWVSDTDGSDNGTPPDVFALRRTAALQAWYEHTPVRRASLPVNGLSPSWRSARYGTLAEIDILNTRLYRSDQPCGDGFKPVCPGVDDPHAQVISAEQEAWLVRNMTRDTARWNCVAQQVMMMSVDRRRRPEEPQRILNMDSWAAYEVPRRRLLARMRGLDNVVVLTGDEHQNFAGELHDGDRVVAAEFVATSISSGGDGSNLRPGSDVFLANNPQVKFINDQRGYVTCDVNAERWATQYKVVDSVSTRGAPISLRATASVAHGTPGLTIS